MKKGFNFQGAKKVGEKFKDAKTAKTFRIDMDVFLWLRKETERTEIPYQTLMNAKLRESIPFIAWEIRDLLRCAQRFVL